MAGLPRHQEGQTLGILQPTQTIPRGASGIQVDAISLPCQRTSLRYSGQLLAPLATRNPSVGAEEQSLFGLYTDQCIVDEPHRMRVHRAKRLRPRQLILQIARRDAKGLERLPQIS